MTYVGRDTLIHEIAKAGIPNGMNTLITEKIPN